MRTPTRPTGRLLSRTTQLPARIGILVMLALGLVFVVAPHASAQTARDTVVVSAPSRGGTTLRLTDAVAQVARMVWSSWKRVCIANRPWSFVSR